MGRLILYRGRTRLETEDVKEPVSVNRLVEEFTKRIKKHRSFRRPFTLIYKEPFWNLGARFDIHITGFKSGAFCSITSQALYQIPTACIFLPSNERDRLLNREYFLELLERNRTPLGYRMGELILKKPLPLKREERRLLEEARAFVFFESQPEKGVEYLRELKDKSDNFYFVRKIWEEKGKYLLVSAQGVEKVEESLVNPLPEKEEEESQELTL